MSLKRIEVGIEKDTVLLFLVLLPIFLYLLSFLTIGVIDVKLINSFEFLKGLFPAYYFFYYLVIGVLTFIVYRNLTQARVSNRLLFLGLYYLIFLAIALDFPRFHIGNPLQGEIWKPGKALYIYKSAKIAGMYTPHPIESVGNSLFFGILLKISSISSLGLLEYLAPNILLLLTTFFVFSVTYTYVDKKLSLLAGFFFLSLFFEPLFANRYSFALPLYVLVVGYTFSYIKEKNMSVSKSVIIILLLGGTIISHPTYSLFAIIFFFSVLLFLLFHRFFSNNDNYDISWKVLTRRIKNLFAIGTTGWLTWFLINRKVLPGVNRLETLWIIVKGGLTSRTMEAVFSQSLKPIYSFVTHLRFIFASFLLIPLLLIFLYIYIKKFSNPIEYFNLNDIAISVSYFIFLLLLSIGFFLSQSVVFRIYMITLPLASFLLVLLLDRGYYGKRVKRQLKKSLLVVIVIASFFTTYLVWIPNLTYSGIPSQTISMTEAVEKRCPKNLELNSVGSNRFLFKYPFARSTFNPTIMKRADLDNFEAVKGFTNSTFKKGSYIYIDSRGSRHDSKYKFEPSLLQRILFIHSKLQKEKNFSKIYSNSRINSIWIVYS